MPIIDRDLQIKKWDPRILLHSGRFSFRGWLGIKHKAVALSDGLDNEAVPFSCLRTVKRTIGAYGVAGCDFNFANPVNMTAQNIDLGAIIPANARALEVRVRNVATFTGLVSLAITAGNASAGAQFLASIQCFTLDVIVGTLLAILWTVVPSNAAAHVWIGATPGANWSLDTTNVGKLEVNVTYIEQI